MEESGRVRCAIITFAPAARNRYSNPVADTTPAAGDDRDLARQQSHDLSPLPPWQPWRCRMPGAALALVSPRRSPETKRYSDTQPISEIIVRHLY